jgi:D-alanyl-lipoteichoic acid acyltransferase DltB (MBOAT superfamily)
MLFNSFEFLIFLPLVFIGYWFIFNKLKVQNLFIVVVSYLFYGWWDWRFLFLIFLTTILCFASGYGIGLCKEKKIKRLICALNIFANIAILCCFKYFNFFAENLNILFEQFGYKLDWFTIDVLLPIGISFYTFQAISYPIDVYRNKTKVTGDLIAFMAFISFFPQLVAGPIERSTQLLPQFERKRIFNYFEAIYGMRQILWGLFKKIVIADNCAMIANRVFENYTDYSAPVLWFGAIAFAFQIYGDFSGYSDIAIGVARLFGIKLCQNFHYPYFSRDIAEFWRRWHISLNTWFRDYIYIPLGGSRCSTVKVVRNTMIIFLISGLWHGANWTFIVWGAYHGLLFLPMILMGKNRKNLGTIANGQKLPSLKNLLSILVTFFLVVIGWIIFRSDNIDNAAGYLNSCITHISVVNYNNSLEGIGLTMVFSTIVMICLMISIEWTQRFKVFGLQIVEGKPLLVRWSAYLTLIFFIIIFAGQQEQFIYFQF